MITKRKIAANLYKSAIPCLESFFQKHQNETFYAFAVEIYAEYGYFHICANSTKTLQLIIDRYTKAGETVDSIVGDKGEKWINQEWEYFDLNRDCDIWNKNWSPMAEQIDSHIEKIESSKYEAIHFLRINMFSMVFEAAARKAYNKILSSGVLDNVKKTNDFKTFVFEHHEEY